MSSVTLSTLLWFNHIIKS